MGIYTQIDGVPDSEQAKPGMAFFAGTGPFDKTCGSCIFRGYSRQSSRSTWNEEKQQEFFRFYRVSSCAKFRSMTGHHGTPVDKDYAACKYYEPKDKKRRQPVGQGEDACSKD